MDRALCVTTDAELLNWLASDFSGNGFEVLTCQEVEAAKALLAFCAVDVAIVDLHLSAHGGLEGLKLIHHIATHFPKARIFAVSDKKAPDIESLAREAGALALFAKPVDPNNLAPLFAQKNQNQTGPIHHLGKLDDFLASQQIKAQLQPILDLRAGKTSLKTLGIESLARTTFSSPFFKPEILFAYAAGKERLFEMDMFCIEAAFREAKELEDFGKLFINVRPHSLINPSFVNNVKKMADQFGYDSQNIVFELTEQQAILNVDAFAATLKNMRRLGFGIAVDDFGVGFANLELIANLKPDYIKLSGSFCRNIESDKVKQVIVQSTAEMASRLETPMIIENVETEKELEKVLSLGVQYAQGYYFSKPCSASSLKDANWLARYPLC